MIAVSSRACIAVHPLTGSRPYLLIAMKAACREHYTERGSWKCSARAGATQRFKLLMPYLTGAGIFYADMPLIRCRRGTSRDSFELLRSLLITSAYFRTAAAHSLFPSD
jgi:hypothetical protein